MSILKDAATHVITWGEILQRMSACVPMALTLTLALAVVCHDG